MAAVELGIEDLTDATAVGRGGNANVYRAYEATHDRWVAVKVLRGLADEDDLRRFDRERRAMGRLSQHDGIVTVYASGFTARGEPYLTMPLLDGSLDDRLNTTGPFPWREAVELIAEVATTVQAAHAQQVIHRDLKPANIMLSPTGRPLVADFGIARLTGGSASLMSSAITMTPAFSPPETAAGATPSVATDVYSLGATLVALLTGEPPFSRTGDDNLFALLRRVAEDPVPDVRPHGVPDRVAVVVERAMSKEPADRPASAGELAVLLREAATDEAPAGPPVSGSSRSDATRAVPTFRDPAAATDPEPQATPVAVVTGDAPPNRNRTVVAVVAAVVVAIVAAIVVLRPGDDDGTTTAPADPATTEAPSTTVAGGAERTSADTSNEATDTPTDTPTDPRLGEPAVELLSPLVAEVEVGLEPSTPLEAHGSVWIPSVVEDAVHVVDPGTREVTDVVPVESSPLEPVEAAGMVWVPNSGVSSLSVIDPALMSVVATVDVGLGPQPPVVSHDRLWVAVTGDDAVAAVDPSTRAVTATLAVGIEPRRPLAALGRIWVPNHGDATLSVIDPAGPEVVAAIPVGGAPGTPAATADRIWVPTETGVTIVDAGTLEVLADLRLGSESPFVLAGERFVWIALESAGTFVRLDPDGTGRVDIAVDPPSSAIEVDGRLWIVSGDDRTLTVLADDPTGNPIVTVDLGPGPSRPVAVGDEVWIAHTGGHTVLVADPALVD